MDDMDEMDDMDGMDNNGETAWPLRRAHCTPAGRLGRGIASCENPPAVSAGASRFASTRRPSRPGHFVHTVHFVHAGLYGFS